jgi:hypothetical protein
MHLSSIDDDPCPACDDWWTHHNALHDELEAKPWEWPCIEYPDAECPYPADSDAAKYWEKEPSWDARGVRALP